MIFRFFIAIASLLLGLLTLMAQPASQTQVINKSQSSGHAEGRALPANIKLTIEIEEMPGCDNPLSFWDTGYEIRLLDWRTVVERTKSGTEIGDAGILLTQSSFAHRLLSEKDNRKVTVTVPVDSTLRERLQQQAQTPQAFSLRSAVRLYDGQLDRNFTFRVDRLWQFKLFPDGEARISIKIKPDGAFAVWGPIPKTLPPGYTIVGTPPAR